jgi:hypothetical protein
LLIKVGDEIALFVLDHSSNWNCQDEAFAVGSIAEVAGPIATVSTSAVRVEVEI